MIENQEMININVPELMDKVRACSNEGYRLVQICATKLPESIPGVTGNAGIPLPGIELNYSFDKDHKFRNYRITLTSTDQEIPSVSGIYLAAFLYENEMHDLFGIKISGIAIDYKGKFYKTSVKTPFNPAQKTDGGQKNG